MNKVRNHAVLTAEQACRLALGAFYNAAASKPRDGAELVGAWMLALSNRLGNDDVTAPHYREIVARWEREDNPSSSEQFAIVDNRLNNAVSTGADNAR